MADINIRLDVDSVQSIAQAKVRPAVEAALAKVDVQALIERELSRPSEPAGNPLTRLYMLGADCPTPVTNLIESMVVEGVETIAKEFVQRAIRQQREAIEDVLLRMMRDSPKRLVKAFADAMERGLDEAEWKFDLEMKVSAGTGDSDV